MEQRKYTVEMLNAIQDRQYTVTENGLEVLIKPIPETDEPGVMDPRFYESVAPMLTGFKGLLVKTMMKAGARRKTTTQKSADQMRKMMNGIKSIPIIGSVDVKQETICNGALKVPIRIYTPKQPKEGLQPVFYYIHGGGFVAGGMDVVEEMCKLVVEKTGCVAVQPEYRLAPEHPFPAGLDDCYAVLKWIYQNASGFGGDPEKICISGDSAGGNLATVCAMRDRDDGNRMVKVQALLYPTVDAAHMKQNMETANQVYEITEKHRRVLSGMLDLMGGSLGSVSMGGFLGAEDETIPYISPSLGDLKGMPPSIILLGEYDFLRVEGDAYARKLKQAGVNVKAVRYRGLSHGFADQVGVIPQAEDSLEEIGNFMMEHLA